MRLSFIHNLNRGNITPRLYFRASWKKITNPSHDPFSSTDPSAFPFSIHFFSSSRLSSILLTLDRERGKEDSSESRRCCCLFSPWNTFCRWRKRRRGGGKEETRGKRRAFCPRGNKNGETKSIERWDLFSK